MTAIDSKLALLKTPLMYFYVTDYNILNSLNLLNL